MPLRHSFLVGACLGATLVVSSVARADVPPPNECPTQDTAGEACSTAGPNFDEDGVCVSATCGSPHPELDSGPSTYACVLCMLSDAGPASNTCQQAGGQCVALVPSSCADGHVGSATTYSCGGGDGVECCLPGSADAGPTPDASTGGQTLHSSSSCAMAPGDAGFGLSALSAFAFVAGARWRRRGRVA